MRITDNILYVGVDDLTIDLFESQYIVPCGVSYNSYVIMDEKIAVMDTVDARKTSEWLLNVGDALSGREPDYLIVSHMEPDHAGSIKAFSEKYPSAKIVATQKAITMMGEFFEAIPLAAKSVAVKEGEELELGRHTLVFYMAPMVHWPEVMVTYEKSTQTLFSADAFGKFGALSCDEDWACEARRYYINIVGKYGANVQALLKKLSGLSVNTICPLHGPILTENLGYYIEKYDIWSSYRPEDDGVLIAFASIHGNTARAARRAAEYCEMYGAKKVVLCDLARCDMAEAVEDAFRYDKLILASATYDGELFTPMETFLTTLKKKNFQKRRIALIENGSWGPTAAGKMVSKLSEMKNITVCEKTLTIKSAMKSAQENDLEELVKELLSI